MADNVAITAGSGTTVAADEVVDGTLGTVKVQYVKIMDGTLDGTAKATVGANGIKVDPTSAVDKGAGTGGSLTQRVIVDSSQLAGNQNTAQTMASGFQLVDAPTDGTLGVRLGSLTETAPATDTASSGSNGRLQRIAQRLTSILAGIPLIPATSGGLSRSRTLIPNNTTAIVVKATAGQVYKIRATNNSATIAYIKLYDAASATAGSGTPVDTVMIPAATTGGAGIVDTTDIGVAHTTGITFIVTTGIADADTAAPAANAYVVTVLYK